MLEECREVFREVLAKQQNKGRDIILDSYIPADGTYLLVDKQGTIKVCADIKFDKKTKELRTSHSDLTEIRFSRLP